MVTKEKQTDRQRRAWAKRYDEVSELERQLDQHDKAKRRTARSLVILPVALLTVLALHDYHELPEYFDLKDAFKLACLYVALAALGVSSVIAYRSNAHMAERRGYCLGKYGKTPAQLGVEDDVDDEA